MFNPNNPNTDTKPLQQTPIPILTLPPNLNLAARLINTQASVLQATAQQTLASYNSAEKQILELLAEKDKQIAELQRRNKTLEENAKQIKVAHEEEIHALKATAQAQRQADEAKRLAESKKISPKKLNQKILDYWDRIEI